MQLRQGFGVGGSLLYLGCFVKKEHGFIRERDTDGVFRLGWPCGLCDFEPIERKKDSVVGLTALSG
jgi:hypothetical protein